jgi:hypothetical protein
VIAGGVTLSLRAASASEAEPEMTLKKIRSSLEIINFDLNATCMNH